MKRLLTICIPTYKRPEALKGCIDSIIAQIEQSDLGEDVGLYVANDASPDNTKEILQEYAHLHYFVGVSREHNLGMSVNNQTMLKEAAEMSVYQLIVTDDDYLQPHVLQELVDSLQQLQVSRRNVPAIWTPRHSYTEDGELHCVSCSPFSTDMSVLPSAANAGRHMSDGFVLSGLIIRAQQIDFDFWDQYKENAYFPMIFFGDLVYREGAMYWHKNLVHHTVLNKCHWESWGRSDLLIEIRKISDYFNTYGVMGARMKSTMEKLAFYIAAFPNIIRAMARFMHSEQLSGERLEVISAVDEQKAKGVFKLMPALRWIIPLALLTAVIFVVIKLMIFSLLNWVKPEQSQVFHNRRRIDAYSASLKNIPVMFRLIF